MPHGSPPPERRGGTPLNPPLLSVLLDAPDAARTIAFGAAGTASHADLVARVGALVSSPSIAGPRWLYAGDDPFRMAVMLLAAAVRGACVALPPILHPGTLRELASGSDAVFADRAGDGALDPLDVEPGTTTPSLRFDPAAAAPIAQLFTSGSSGPGRAIP